MKGILILLIMGKKTGEVRVSGKEGKVYMGNK